MAPGGMTIVSREPLPVLRPFVASLVYYETPLPMARDRVLPLRTVNLTVNLADDEMRWYDGAGLTTARVRRGAVVLGPRIKPITIDIPTRRGVRVEFRPAGVFPFLRGTAASLFDDPLVEIEEVWGQEGGRLRERLLEAPTSGAILSEVETTLLRQAVQPLDPDFAVSSAVAMLGRGVSVTEVADRLGITNRTLLRRFTAHVGLSPKLFARVLRLYRVIASLPAAGEVDWAQVATDCGYFDQSHLINEFWDLAGTTPARYRPRVSDPTHMPLAS